MTAPTIGKTSSGRSLAIDVERLVSGRRFQESAGSASDAGAGRVSAPGVVRASAALFL